MQGRGRPGAQSVSFGRPHTVPSGLHGLEIGTESISGHRVADSSSPDPPRGLGTSWLCKAYHLCNKGVPRKGARVPLQSPGPSAPFTLGSSPISSWEVGLRTA